MLAFKNIYEKMEKMRSCLRSLKLERISDQEFFQRDSGLEQSMLQFLRGSSLLLQGDGFTSKSMINC